MLWNFLPELCVFGLVAIVSWLETLLQVAVDVAGAAMDTFDVVVVASTVGNVPEAIFQSALLFVEVGPFTTCKLEGIVECGINDCGKA